MNLVRVKRRLSVWIISDLVVQSEVWRGNNALNTRVVFAACCIYTGFTRRSEKLSATDGGVTESSDQNPAEQTETKHVTEGIPLASH
jgi:hypothetical protein